MSSTPENIKWDERGVFLQAVELSFYGEASPEAWASFANVCGIDHDKERPYRGRFSAIPENQRPGELYLTASFHPSPKHDGTAAHWLLNWDVVPSTKPPQTIIDSSKRVGGYPSVLNKMVHNWPTNPLLNVDSTVTYVVHKNVNSFRFVSRHKPKKISGHTLTRTASTWSINPPSGAVKRLTIADTSDNVAIMIATGSCQIKLSINTLNDMDAITWQSVQTFLKKTS
jgi:hypothetical protein